MRAKRFFGAGARGVVLALAAVASLAMVAPAAQSAPLWPSGYGPDVSAGPDLGSAPIVKHWREVQIPAEIRNMLPKDKAPCKAPGVRVCIEKRSQLAWLMDRHGKTIWGPAPIATGQPGYETPPAVTKVYIKKPYHWSTMHFAHMHHVLFFNGDMAIHAMNTWDNTPPKWYSSHGCIRIGADAAKYIYDRTNLGDLVQVQE